MNYDITVFPDELASATSTATFVESQGYDALWLAEVAHNPFLPLTLAAEVTERIKLGTQIAVAFARSPMTIANIAWDLQDYSGGRFILGLGTQVKAHIRKRFGMTWSDPVAALREYIESLRAIWNTWQNDAPLNYRGEHYTFTLMTPFFNPGPIQHPDIPIYIAGVNQKNCRLAGELCQGLHAHAFHTVDYLHDVVLANVEDGLQAGGKSRSEFKLVVPVFTVTGRTDDELQRSIQATKQHIAFYASTPSYRVVLETHGWESIGETLGKMARNGDWASMWQEISDDMLEKIAIVAPADQLRDKLAARYDGLADRLCLSWQPRDETSTWLMQQAAAPA